MSKRFRTAAQNTLSRIPKHVLKVTLLLVEGIVLCWVVVYFFLKQINQKTAFWGQNIIGIGVVWIACIIYGIWCLLRKGAVSQSSAESAEASSNLLNPEGLQRDLTSLERYFTSLKDPYSMKDADLRRIVGGQLSCDLQALGNPALIMRLLKLYESPNGRLRTMDKRELIEVLINAGSHPIDQVLEDQLVNGNKQLVMEILTGLQISNRSIGDVLRFSKLANSDRISE